MVSSTTNSYPREAESPGILPISSQHENAMAPNRLDSIILILPSADGTVLVRKFNKETPTRRTEVVFLSHAQPRRNETRPIGWQSTKRMNTVAVQWQNEKFISDLIISMNHELLTRKMLIHVLILFPYGKHYLGE